jgi:hypothetical protein
LVVSAQAREEKGPIAAAFGGGQFTLWTAGHYESGEDEL